MKNKRGISLIVLVITIIVMIILASAIILALSGNGVIFKTNKAKFQNDMATMKEELSVYISDKELQTNGAYDSDNLNANKNNLVEENATVEGKTILDIIKSMDKKYLDKLEIVNGKLRYTGSNIDEIKWSDEILEGIIGNSLEEEKAEQANTIKLEDSANVKLANYRIYGNGTSLPEEYQQVDYIESTGTQYIDTGIIPQSGDVITIDYEVKPNSNTVVFGSRTSGTYTDSLDQVYLNIPNDGSSYVWIKGLTKKSLGDFGFNTRVKHTLSKVGIEDTFNNTCEFSYYLFSLNNIGTPVANLIGKIYRFSIEGRCDFIPCYRKSDGETGMYDVVNDVFYTNLGTGEFLKGENIGSVGDYLIDMNFDNKWKQGHIAGVESYYSNRITCQNFISSEANTKYTISSNLPDNMQLIVDNGTFTSYPYDESLATYRSGWSDDDITFTAKLNGNITMSIRYKDDSKITPEDVEMYEIKVKKYTNEPDGEAQCVIPIMVSGKNIATDVKEIYRNTHSYEEIIEDDRECVRFTTANTKKYTGIKFKENTQYTMNFDCKVVQKPDENVGMNADIALTIFYTDGSYKNIHGIRGAGWNKLVITSELGKTINTIGIFTNEWRNYVYIDINTFQIEEGTQATEYVPGIEQREYNIYLDEPLRKIGNYVDYIDFRSQEVVRNVEVVDGTSGEQTLKGLDTPVREKITIPNIMLNEGTNIIDVLTTVQPSKIEALYYKK